MGKVKIVHRKGQPGRINTRFGEFNLGDGGVFEVEESLAKSLCDVTIYGDTFTKFQEKKTPAQTQPKPEPTTPVQPKPETEITKPYLKVEDVLANPVVEPKPAPAMPTTEPKPKQQLPKGRQPKKQS